MPSADLVIKEVDPQGRDALALLREAAIEARALYPELFAPDAPWPTNPATPPGGVYLVAYVDGVASGCGALRPIDEKTVEVRRMFVFRHARRGGIARAILAMLERKASGLGYRVMRLETGNRQLPAAALYESCGYARIAPFGEYANDPTSVCYEKCLAIEAGG
jgi:GNAT superfamily N-acetyltransferase